MRRVSLVHGVDLLGALSVLTALIAVCPSWVSLRFAADMYALGTSVLAVVFSVFIAALAIIVSASDNDFVRFLEEDGLFSDIVWGLRATLVILFCALCLGVALYVYGSYQLAMGMKSQHRLGVLLFGTALAYGLFATLSSTLAALDYAQRRAMYIRASK
jgi:hypothetical protein